MAGQRGLNRDFRSLAVPDFADHDGVRILTQHRAQDLREGEADLALDLDLIDALELVFDRVLDGEQLAARHVEAEERGIETGRLAATRRARDEKNSLRPGQGLDQRPLGILEEAERAKIVDQARAVENAHHHALAVHRRHRRDAQVEVAAAKGEADAAILRQTPFRDVHARHYLDARDHGGAQTHGRFGRNLQNSVDAVAHEEPAVKGLDMNVGGAAFDGANDQQIDQTDYRRLACQIAQPVDVFDGAGIVPALDLLDQLAELAAGVEETLVRRLDIRRRRHQRQNAAADPHLYRAPHIAVERIGHREADRVLADIDWQDTGGAQELGADLLAEDGDLRKICRARNGKSELRGDRLGNVQLAGETEIGEHHLETVLAFGAHAKRTVDRRRVQLFTAQQTLDEGVLECLSIRQDERQAMPPTLTANA